MFTAYKFTAVAMLIFLSCSAHASPAFLTLEGDCQYDHDVAGRNIRSEIIGREYRSVQERCGQMCRDESRCTFYIVFWDERRCYLKESYGKGPEGITGYKKGATTCKKP